MRGFPAIAQRLAPQAACALVLGFAPTVALAYESPDQPVVFADEVDVWSAAEFDTGELPNGSPVTVRFFIASDGGAITDISSASLMDWPDPLGQMWESQVEGGMLSLITDISMNLELGYDIFGVSDTVPLWSEGIAFADVTVFDGLLLPQGTPESANVQAAGGSLQTFNLRQSIVTGVEVDFSLDLFPAAEASLTGLRIDTTDGADLLAMDFDGDVSFFDVPASHPGYIELLATYYGDLHAVLSLMLVPTVDLCVIGQCFEVAAFDIPIDLIDASQARVFSPVQVNHPLPSLIPPDTSHDFGEVLVGNTLNLEVPLANQGEMYLEGNVEIVGSDTISVFPTYFYAEPGNEDGVVVSFLPDEVAETTAMLRITSNDPLQPVLDIPLRGLGWEPEEEIETSDDGFVYEGRSIGVEGCGCQQGSTGAGWLSVFGLGLLLRRRRG
ncbi:MAG: hypothetical protein KC912_08000 [Proteobacteria bacterium]|nr:hypothetical protein [Pseudomonadota bacterium]